MNLKYKIHTDYDDNEIFSIIIRIKEPFIIEYIEYNINHILHDVDTYVNDGIYIDNDNLVLCADLCETVDGGLYPNKLKIKIPLTISQPLVNDIRKIIDDFNENGTKYEIIKNY